MSIGSFPDRVRAVRARAGLSWAPVVRAGEVAGPDAVSFLNTQLPLDVAALAPGEGGYTALLDPKGRITVDLTLARVEPDRILLLAAAPLLPDLLARLERVHIRESLEIRERTDLVVAQIHGPGTPAVLVAAGGARIPTVPYRYVDLELAGERIGFVGDPWSGDVGGHLLVPAGSRDAIAAALREAGRREGLVEIDAGDLETLRIEGGRLRVGIDLDDRTLLPELDREEMVSRDKGCYVGQETVARVHSRGRVQRLVRGLVIEGSAVPPRGTLILSGEDPVGETGSAIESPSLDRIVALARVRRQVAEPGTVVHLQVDARRVAARVSALPLYRPPGPRDQADRLYREGNAAFTADELERALSLYERATLMNPEHYAAFEAIGVCQERLGRLPEAVETMESLSEMDPDNVMAWTNLSRYYAEQGRIDDAERIKGHVTFLVWKKEAGEKEAERRAKEDQTQRQRNLQERVGLFQQVLDLDPDDVVARFGLGKVLLDLGRHAEAVPHFSKAIEVQTDYSMAFNHLGTCLLELGRSEEARDVLDRGIAAAEVRGDFIPLRDMKRKRRRLETGEAE